MADWLSSMEQTFEFYIVDPSTWGDAKLLTNVKSCTINRDSEAETLGSATISVTESVGECYIRVYLITIQNGIKERHPLGTFLVQTPSSNYTGKLRDISMDAYTPLLELKENPPAIGYTIPKDGKIMELASRLADENMRAPVIRITPNDELDSGSRYNSKLEFDFIASTNDTWLSYLSDLISNADYSFALDELGRVTFEPKQELESLQPVWTFNDDNSSILYPDITMDHDLYGVPNVIEIISSTNMGGKHIVVTNEDPNSPTSIQARGRRITHREVDPSMNNTVIVESGQLKDYAKRRLKELSSIEYTISFTHGYCPVRIGDCIRLNYNRAGLSGIKAKVISQSIKCQPGCPVTTKAVFTTELWR